FLEKEKQRIFSWGIIKIRICLIKLVSRSDHNEKQAKDVPEKLSMKSQLFMQATKRVWCFSFLFLEVGLQDFKIQKLSQA
ncbi:hypothetical protein ACJX0J_012444, partial [Zea mays]